MIGSGRLSFGSPDLLYAVMGVRPGSVTVFGLVNDAKRRVRLVLDAALIKTEPVNFHPLTNSATTAISLEGLQRFLSALDIAPLFVDFAAVAGAPPP